MMLHPYMYTDCRPGWIKALDKHLKLFTERLGKRASTGKVRLDQTVKVKDRKNDQRDSNGQQIMTWKVASLNPCTDECMVMRYTLQHH